MNDPVTSVFGTILVPTSPAALLDRIIILKLKCEKLSVRGRDTSIVAAELSRLSRLCDEHVNVDVISDLVEALVEVNTALWELEDDIRMLEQDRSFDARFIEVARAIHLGNDKRSFLKRAIDDRLGGVPWAETKCYRGEAE